MSRGIQNAARGHQAHGGKTAKTSAGKSANNSANFRSDDEAGNTDGISGDTIRNILSLNNLVPELMQIAWHFAGNSLRSS